MVALAAMLLLLADACGYYAYRTSMWPDVFGGDSINVAGIVGSSYGLHEGTTLTTITGLAKWLRQGEQLPQTAQGFAWSQLNGQAREALDAFLADPADTWRRAAFEHHLNLSLVDRAIEWPDVFDQAQKIPGSWMQKDPVRERNLRALSSAYPMLPYLPADNPFCRGLVQGLLGMPYKALFLLLEPTRYTPITNLWAIALQRTFQCADHGFETVVAATALLHGAFVAIVFVMAWLELRSRRWSLLAALLAGTSMSVLQAVHPLFSLPYLLVPTVMSLGLVCYLLFDRSRAWPWLAGFVACAVVAPWLREFAGALAFIVAADEALFRSGRNRSWVVLGLCVPLMAHAIFPSALAWGLGLNGGIVSSLFGQANAQSQLTTPNGRFFGLLFVQVPPSLWLLAVGGITAELARRGLPITGWRPLDTMAARLGARSTAAVFGALFILFLVCVLILAGSERSWYGISFRPGWPLLIGMGAFLALLAMASARRWALVPLYFTAMFLPDVVMSLAEIHLSFLIAPFMVMVTAALRAGVQVTARGRPLWRRLALTLLAVGALDQVANIVAVHEVQRDLSKTNQALADWLVENTARHSSVISNFYAYTDIYRGSDYWFDAYESVDNNPFGPKYTISDSERLEELIRNHSGLRDIYLIDSQHEYYSFQRGYHPNKWVREPLAGLDELATITSNIHYIYIDPMKALLPRRFVSFPGYMDWDTDFYFANDDIPFRRVVRASYTIYRLHQETWDRAIGPLAVPGYATSTEVEAHPRFNTSDDFWEDSGPRPWRLRTDFGQPTMLTSYGLRAGPRRHRKAGNIQMPKEWAIEGSNDGTIWHEVDRRRDDQAWAHGEWRPYRVSSRPTFRMYRISVDESWDPNTVRLYQWSLSGRPSP